MLELPVPPSVNHCWKFTSRGVFKKSRYIHWLAESAIEANRQAFQGCTGPGYISGDDCRTLQVLSISVGMPEPKACIRVTIQAITNPVQILTKAEAKQAARASIPRAKKAQKPKVEASTHIEVEDASERSFFPTLDELREIARTSKSRSKEMAEHIARCCSA